MEHSAEQTSASGTTGSDVHTSMSLDDTSNGARGKAGAASNAVPPPVAAPSESPSAASPASPSSLTGLHRKVDEIVQQFGVAKTMWKVSSERELLRLPHADLRDLSSTMFRLLQSLPAFLDGEGVVGGDVPRKRNTAAAAFAMVPTQGSSQFGSPGTNGDLGIEDSFAGEGVLSARGKGRGTETNGGDSEEYSGASTPFQVAHVVSPIIPGTVPASDREVFKLTEDALQRLNYDVPGVLISGLVNPGDGDDSSDNVSDTRMSVSRSDALDDGVFDGVNDYLLLEEIGRGQAGKVFKAMDTRNNQIVAIKLLPRHLVVEPAREVKKSLSLVVPEVGDGNAAASASSAAETRFKKEVMIMKRLKHRNIARLIEVIDDEIEKQVYLVMPLLDGGPLISFGPDRTCEPLPVDVVRRHLSNIVSGLQYLKKHRIVHRDLKPDNIILNKGVATLVDFGQSEWADGARDAPAAADDPLASSGSDAGGPTVRVRNLGTPAFMAPEVIRGERPDFPSDVWSLGVILYAMLYGKLPFRGVFAGRRGAAAASAGQPDLMDQILYRDPELDEDQVDFVWNDLISMMLEKNPQDRVTLSDIKRHAAMTGGPGSRSVSSAGSELDPSGLTPRDFGDLESAVVERRRPVGPAFVVPKTINQDTDGSVNMGSCLQSPVQRLPAHQRLARFRLSGAKGGGTGASPNQTNAELNNSNGDKLVVLPGPVLR